MEMKSIRGLLWGIGPNIPDLMQKKEKRRSNRSNNIHEKNNKLLENKIMERNSVDDDQPF